MAKCIMCDKKIKISRNCPALNTLICSTCCGVKRGKEIDCTEDCSYFNEGILKENRKYIVDLVKESFNIEYEDIFRREDVVEMVASFEIFIYNNFYSDEEVSDEFFFDCYMKMYYMLDGKGSIYTFNDKETEILNEFIEIAGRTETSIDMQKQILLRMMKTITQISGTAYGNRMYLEVLRDNFTGTGIITDLMKDE